MEDTTRNIDKPGFGAGFFVASMLCVMTISAAISIPWFDAKGEYALRDCARKHDVYRCEFVAVPVIKDTTH